MPALREAGYEPAAAALQDFGHGQGALAAFRAGGVDLIVDDLSPSLSQGTSPSLHEELLEAALDTRFPLVISNMSRWLQEEQAPATPDSLGARGSPAIERLLNAIARELRRRPEDG